MTQNDREEYYNAWKTDTASSLEYNFFQSLPLEELPLDDDMLDYLENNSDEFAAFCQEEFNKYLEAQ